MMGESLKVNFARQMTANFNDKSPDELLAIINEAISFAIRKEGLVKKYIGLYISHTDVFINKPKWLKYVLNENVFLADDKMSFIEKKITTIYAG